MEIALQLGYQSFKDPSKYIEGMGTNWVQKSQTAVYAPDLIVFSINGGERGIRTLGGLAPTTVFETAPFNHSGTSPQDVRLRKPGKPGRKTTSLVLCSRFAGQMQRSRCLKNTRNLAQIKWCIICSALDKSWHCCAPCVWGNLPACQFLR